ncbi:Nuclear control of ATPase protein 2 [Erysiphe neolycopersici]|uniref:Nuclear control of ATPase protein 2 n=1 Tax=Erysiphe neolycopersici TaxID=212602 RepID=A0A420HDV8_9PEZI|nr:Nuclear control of ATPase protein 2 [Erysiphe neolycopersici]
MSIIVDLVRNVDSQLDQVQVLPGGIYEELYNQSLDITSPPQIQELQKIVKELSVTALSTTLKPSRISTLLERANLLELPNNRREKDVINLYGNELQWILIGKAATQIYGLLLETLLEQMIQLNGHIRYWEKVIHSHSYSSLYAIQTSPKKLWSWSNDIYHDTINRVKMMKGSHENLSLREIRSNFLARWRQFYSLLKKSIHKKSLESLQRRTLSPIALCQSEARQKLSHLKRLRDTCASGLGILIVEGLVFDMGDNDLKENYDFNGWKDVVEESISYMDTVLKNVLSLDTGASKFENTVFERLSREPHTSLMEENVIQVAHPARLSERLQYILKVLIPNHNSYSQKLARLYGQPSRFERLWLPSVVLLLSSTAILQLSIRKRDLIVSIIKDLGKTSRDFCINWLLEPIKKVISTIRHDPESELALMSKESLSGDRDSLERMVIDFMRDNSRSTGLDSSFTESEITNMRKMVREGNLTPILRAYEKELKNPLLGIIWGDLLRTLLIQIQKSKVDLEIALSGIDALLKSQELVFGFVGLTPGVLVCFATIQYFLGVIRNMSGSKKGYKASQSIRILDRILTTTPIGDDQLSYKCCGLLFCEVHILRKHADKLFPANVEREFLEDINDLCDIRLGLRAQHKALKRIRRGYAKWLQ